MEGFHIIVPIKGYSLWPFSRVKDAQCPFGRILHADSVKCMSREK